MNGVVELLTFSLNYLIKDTLGVTGLILVKDRIVLGFWHLDVGLVFSLM